MYDELEDMKFNNKEMTICINKHKKKIRKLLEDAEFNTTCPNCFKLVETFSRVLNQLECIEKKEFISREEDGNGCK